MNFLQEIYLIPQLRRWSLIYVNVQSTSAQFYWLFLVVIYEYRMSRNSPVRLERPCRSQRLLSFRISKLNIFQCTELL